MKKSKYCIDPECRGCDVERSPELVKAMEFATRTDCMKKKWFEKPVGDCFTDDIELAPLPKAVPCVKAGYAGTPFQATSFYDVIKKEGKTLMRYNDNYASASANVTTVQSDSATQRDFLLNELGKADYPKTKELQKLFNLYVDNTPKTYKEMIDVIKAGTYTIDPKIAKKIAAFDTSDDGNDLSDFCYGPMYGIVWPGPVTDTDGYMAAEVEKSKQYTAAKRIIMTGDATAGLKALQDFEAWLPVGKSN